MRLPLPNPARTRVARSPRARPRGPADLRARTLSVAMLGALLTPLAQAELVYHAKARVEGVVSGWTYQHEILVDPDPGPVRKDSSQVHAGRELLLQGSDGFGNALVAQARAVADGSFGGLSAHAGSMKYQSPSYWNWYAASWAEAAAGVNFSSLLQGAPGTTGTLTLRTRLRANANGPIVPSSSASVGASAFIQAQSPLGPCTSYGATCRGDSEHFSAFLKEGESFAGPVDQFWELQITVNAGELFSMGMSVGASGNAGYGVGVALGAEPGPLLPFPSSAGLESRAELASYSSTQDLMATMWLSPGLEFADTQGLQRLPDGSWGFAAPVPEPSTLAFMTLGLAWVVTLALRGRRAEPWRVRG